MRRRLPGPHACGKHTMVRSGGGEAKYVCEECNLRTPHQFVYERHINSVHLKKRDFQCKFPGCTRTFATDYNWLRHVKSRHLRERRWPCPACTKKLTRRTKVLEHLGRVHKITHITKQDLVALPSQQLDIEEATARAHEEVRRVQQEEERQREEQKQKEAALREAVQKRASEVESFMSLMQQQAMREQEHVELPRIVL